MKRITGVLAVLTAGVILSACGPTTVKPAAQAVRPAPTVTKTVIVTKTLPPKTIVKWRTRTITVTSPASVSCFSYGGRAYLTSPGAGIPAVNGCTISIKPIYPLSTGEATVTVTAPDGGTGSYTASWAGQ